ncbi:MAG: glycerate kinase [Candidatus Omnitrophica bacterium]|nr:glycerate kinase [Candidatus Omnitrophota bacterium]
MVKRRLKILVSPAAFKESLSAWEVCRAIEKGISRVFPNATIYKVPLADGGQGTVDALVKATGGYTAKKYVTGPLGRKVFARYGLLGKKTAIIEMSSASGLHLVPFNKRNPLNTTTFGTGELIRACLDKKCNHIMIGLGDSATNDGGVGMAQALGIEFKDKLDRKIGWGGKNLKKIEYIDIKRKDERLKKVKVTILSDVKNPLCGSSGAARVFSPQKGASPEIVLELEKGLKHFAKLIKRELGIDIKGKTGAGAAGGLGAGLMAFLGARAVSGIDLVIKFTRLENYIKKVDLIITGEGKLDKQTIYGKAPMGVAKIAKRYDCPVIGIGGMLGDGYSLLYRQGFTSLFSIVEGPITVAQAMKDAEQLLVNASERIARLIAK